MSQFEQRDNIKSCYKLGKTTAKILSLKKQFMVMTRYRKQPFMISLNVSKCSSLLNTKSGMANGLSTSKNYETI